MENKSKIHNPPISVNHYTIFNRNAPRLTIHVHKKIKKILKKDGKKDKTMETL